MGMVCHCGDMACQIFALKVGAKLNLCLLANVSILKEDVVNLVTYTVLRIIA